MKLIRNFFIVFLAYGIGAWLYSVPFVGDQKVYIATAKEMWERGSFLQPYLFGETSYFKPPWLYWTLLAGWKIFGFNLFGTFFFSILATASTALILDFISIELSPILYSLKKKKYPLAGIWFAACAGTLTYGATAQMEIWVVFFYALSWLFFLKHYKSKKIQWLICALLIAGFSALNKSPLYSAFSVLSYHLFLLIAPDCETPSEKKAVRCWFLKPRFYLAHLLGIAAGLSWFLVIWLIDRDRFWNHYILQETFGKQGGNGSSILQMWLDFLTFTFPYTLLLIPAFIQSPILNKKRTIFLLCWSLLPATFFSYFPYRTETYLYILIPALALLLDGSLAECKSSVLKWTSRINSLLIGIALVGLTVLLSITHLVHFLWIILLIIVGIVFLIISWRTKAIETLAYATLGLIFAIRICAFSLGENDIRDLRAIMDRFPERNLAFLDPGKFLWHEIGLLSVTTGKPALRLYSVEEAREALQKGVILMLNKDQENLFSLQEFPQVKETFWWRLQRNFGVPTLKDLQEVGEQKNRRKFRLVWL